MRDKPLIYKLFFEFLSPIGEVSEWLKERAWKARVLQKGTAGSNPALSTDK